MNQHDRKSEQALSTLQLSNHMRATCTTNWHEARHIRGINSKRAVIPLHANTKDMSICPVISAWICPRESRSCQSSTQIAISNVCSQALCSAHLKWLAGCKGTEKYTYLSHVIETFRHVHSENMVFEHLGYMKHGNTHDIVKWRLG